MGIHHEDKTISAGQRRHFNEERLADYLNYLTPGELREMFRLQRGLMLEEEAKLREALSRGNLPALIMAPQKIAGSAGAAGLTTVERLARELEGLARRNKLEQARTLPARISRARREAWEILDNNNLLIQGRNLGLTE